MDRIETMIQMRNDGSTLQAVGDAFGISRERVRQLLKRVGYLGKPDLASKKATAEQQAIAAEKNRQRSREWRAANPEQHRANLRKYCAKRQQRDPAYRLKKSLVSRYRKAIVGACSSTANTLRLLGCSIDEARLHLASQFSDGMSWENFGEWHIDHIRPCASFDLTDPEQQKECFHFSNLQPLWAEENIRKGDRWEAA